MLVFVHMAVYGVLPTNKRSGLMEHTHPHHVQSKYAHTEVQEDFLDLRLWRTTRELSIRCIQQRKSFLKSFRIYIMTLRMSYHNRITLDNMGNDAVLKWTLVELKGVELRPC